MREDRAFARRLRREQGARDAERTAWLEERGICVVRFLDTEVLLGTDEVVERVAELLAEMAGTRSP